MEASQLENPAATTAKHQPLLDAIAALPDDWHGAGTVNRSVLDAIARHCSSLGPIRNSAETGAGRTTLLLSHLSERHCVFAVDDAGSLSQTRASPLLRSDTVSFIDGPTQLTLPKHRFDREFQVVLLDGPHGYPFPDLEYYYFYPHIQTGGLLIIDDVQIPSIGRMLDIIKADAMFELLEVVEDTTFLRRTAAPLVDPLSDSWWLQGFNSAYLEEVTAPPRVTLPSKLLNLLAGITPTAIKVLLPTRLKAKFWKRM
jgi:hypothetical protein